MMDHLRKYAKAYSGGAAATAMVPVGEKMTVIMVWLISLLGVTPPQEVQGAIQYLITGAATGIAVAFVGNRDNGGVPN